VAVHVFLEGTVIPKGMVALVGHAAVATVEAAQCAVTFKGGVEPGAVGSLVLQLKVPRLTTYLTPFVVCQAAAFCRIVDEHEAPLALAVLHV